MPEKKWLSILASSVFIVLNLSGCYKPPTVAEVESALNRKFIALGFIYNTKNKHYEPGTVLSYNNQQVVEQLIKSAQTFNTEGVDYTCSQEGSIGTVMLPAKEDYHNVVEINGHAANIMGGFADAASTIDVSTKSFSFFSLTNAKTQSIPGDLYEKGKRMRSSDCNSSIQAQLQLGWESHYVSTLLTGDLTFAVAVKSSEKTPSTIAQLLASNFGVTASVQDESAGVVLISLAGAPWSFEFANRF